jgi:hypothetical protein
MNIIVIIQLLIIKLSFYAFKCRFRIFFTNRNIGTWVQADLQFTQLKNLTDSRNTDEMSHLVPGAKDDIWAKDLLINCKLFWVIHRFNTNFLG